MPRYFFHVLDGTTTPDLDGTVLPDVEAARHEAVRLCAGLLNEGPAKVWDGEPWQVEVHDEADAPLFTLSFQARDASTSG